ncbi:MAG: MiaB/RimO family radical SAM methylthiotransferase [Phycisphaerales bacterium]|nr:MiaB/RimO family radical SAM methylthiotransferase [Phycisphaerales bacterium]
MGRTLRTFRVRVLGCRVNHAERREIESVLRARGLHEAAPGCSSDIEIVHTCSVTARAAAKSRQAARKAARGGEHPPVVLITGCLAGSDPDEAADLARGGGRTFGHEVPVPEAVAAWIDATMAGEIGQTDPRDATPPAPQAPVAPSAILHLPLAEPPRHASSHIRAEVRVQDGCDAYCTFCIIPRTRPVLRTKPVSVVLDEARRLIDLGHQEIVLAGIFLGAYGRGTALRRKQHALGGDPLGELVDAVAGLPGLRRLRLSSLEPGDVSDELLAAFTAHRNVVTPHLHLPLQSGSNEVLRRMNRQYRIEGYLEMIDRVKGTFESSGMPPALTTDIMCGFPGETDDDFQRTLAVAHQVGFMHMHVFPFSPRAGTAAARWTQDALPNDRVAARVQRLLNLDAELGAAFRTRLLGREVGLFAEQPDPRRVGHWIGRCDHYAMISVKAEADRGDFIRAIAGRIEDDAIVADGAASRSLPVLNPN